MPGAHGLLFMFTSTDVIINYNNNNNNNYNNEKSYVVLDHLLISEPQ